MLTDRILVWRFNRGRAEALRQIHDRHKDALVTLAAALLADKAGAEDVVQDVFVGFVRSTGKFRLTASLKSFLAPCVANGAQNRNRASKATSYMTPTMAAIITTTDMTMSYETTSSLSDVEPKSL